jgi:hypothetical protein
MGPIAKPYFDDDEEDLMPTVDGEYVSERIADQIRSKRRSGWVSESGYRYKPVAIMEKSLPTGIYTFHNTQNDGIVFQTQTFPTDQLISLPDLPSDYILDQMQKFWKNGAVYKERGFVHKRGILLYGKPGCGKTSVARQMCDEVMKVGGVVFSISDFSLATAAISMFRSAEPDRPILTLQEDIEGLFTGNEGEHQVKCALSFLDGQDQFNNIVHIATTNKPEMLEDRFIKRPGRFDLVIGVKSPTEATRVAYIKFTCKDKVSEAELSELVEKTKGLELAYLREIAASFLCLGIPIEESVARLQANSKVKYLKNDSDKGGEMGFVVGYEPDNGSYQL